MLKKVPHYSTWTEDQKTLFGEIVEFAEKMEHIPEYQHTEREGLFIDVFIEKGWMVELEDGDMVQWSELGTSKLGELIPMYHDWLAEMEMQYWADMEEAMFGTSECSNCRGGGCMYCDDDIRGFRLD